MSKLSASEALYGFAGWLTTRREPLVVGSTYLVPPVVELVAEFCKANGLDEPRDGWSDVLKFPETPE